MNGYYYDVFVDALDQIRDPHALQRGAAKCRHGIASLLAEQLFSEETSAGPILLKPYVVREEKSYGSANGTRLGMGFDVGTVTSMHHREPPPKEPTCTGPLIWVPNPSRLDRLVAWLRRKWHDQVGGGPS